MTMTTATDSPVETRGAWFQSARFGLFLHWGAYAVAGRGEWVMNRERIPLEEYGRLYVDNWHAENYDPRRWAQLAVDAGMKYVVLTARHHDGFCLWDTDTTDWNAAKRGPKRDLISPYVEALREAGLKVGLYYSVADWSHPDYPEPFARDWPTGWRDEESRLRFVAYYRSQLDELMTRYGKIDILWYDGCIPMPTDGAEVNAMVRRHQPEILINHRNGDPSDFHVSEQAVKPAPPGVPWEACLTLNENWGWHAGDNHYKDATDVIMLLTQTAASGGNLLLNVGPKPDGTIPGESEAILRSVGDWLRRSRSEEWLADSTRSPFSWNNVGRITTKGSRVFSHLYHSPGADHCLAEIGNRVLAVRLQETGEPLAFEQNQATGRLVIHGIPVPLPDPLTTTIAIDVEGEPEALRPQTSFWIPG